MRKVGWIPEDRYDSRKKAWVILMVTVSFMAFLLFGIRWLTSPEPPVSKYPREETELRGLPASPRILINPPEQITINDQSLYAENGDLYFYQYTDSYYNEDRLQAEAVYDMTGRLLTLNWWEYDMAGNVYREHTQNEEGWEQVRRHIYEYDGTGEVVHEAIYWDEMITEDTYYRYTDLGRAGVRYSYFDDQIDGGISQYCKSHTEFLEDENGNLLCAFKLPTSTSKTPNDVWKMQWALKDSYLINRLQYFDSGWSVNDDDWYEYDRRADEEQFNLYLCNTETGEKFHTMQLLYDWDYDIDDFVLLPSFYAAQYDEDRLLWQLTYDEDRVQYYSVCQYDTDGRLQAAVEYMGNDDEPYAQLHRYEYPAKDRQGHYYYGIMGQEFVHQAKDGSSISLKFSDEGFLAEAKMTDASGNLLQSSEIVINGKNFGKLERMYIEGEMAEGIDGVLEKLEEKAGVYGFLAGQDLVN